MNDTRLRHATDHLDAAEEIIAAITAEGPASEGDRRDLAKLYEAGLYITSAVSRIQAANSENHEGVALRGL